MSNPTESIFTIGFVELLSKSEEAFMEQFFMRVIGPRFRERLGKLVDKDLCF